MTDHENNEGHANCLMCAVRALTEGTPRMFVPVNVGDSVSGVILKIGWTPTRFGNDVLYVDLWPGGHDRVRVRAFASILADELIKAAGQVGDRLTITFTGETAMVKGRFAGKLYKTFTVEVSRGHH